MKLFMRWAPEVVALFLIALVTHLIVGCSFSVNSTPAKADDAQRARAIEITGPVGAVCYAILRDDNTPVGGNCLRAP